MRLFLLQRYCILITFFGCSLLTGCIRELPCGAADPFCNVNALLILSSTEDTTDNRIPSLSYEAGSYSLILNTAITSITPTLTGEQPIDCSSAPPLPAGLVLGTNTCVISGTPSAVQAATDHTITASNSFGSNNTTINITVTPPAQFISVWDTTNNTYSTSANNQIKLPLNSSGTFDFTVDWGDGSTDTITAWDQPEKTHTYSTPGTYTITITGQIDGFGFDNSATEDNSKLIDINQWGQVRLHNNGFQFHRTSLISFTATDNPDLSGVTNIGSMFRNTSSFNGDISSWDVSNVTDMSHLFAFTNDFNQDIRRWDVSNVTDMSYMFYSASSFNQDIRGWNVSNVTNMNTMFRSAIAFNQNISSWDVSNVTDMGSMFRSATVFSQDLNPWATNGAGTLCTNIPSAPPVFDNASGLTPAQLPCGWL